MQGLAKDEAGNVWEVDAQGEPVRMVTPAHSAPQGRVFSLPPNPKEVRAESRADEDQRLQREAGARAAGNDAIGNQLKALELKIKAKELAKGDKEDKEGTDRLGRLNALTKQIQRVRSLYDAGPGSTKGVSGLGDYLPTNSNAQFDTAGASLSQQGLAAFRTPGTGTVSDRDAIMFDRANLPTASTRDLAIEEQLLGLQNRVEEEYRTLGAPAPDWTGKAQQRADNEVPDPATGADLRPPADMRDEPKMEAASGDTREAYDARMSAQVDALINSGASNAMINTVLKRQNLGGITPQSYSAARAWMQKNPGKRYYGSNISRTEDLNIGQKIAGSAPGAFLASMANSATAGIPTALAGPEGQGALDAMAAASPNAAVAGSVVGGVTGMAGAEAAAARMAPAALARFAPRIADTLYGGMSGFNAAPEGEGLTGAVTGAGLGVAGGIVGQGAARAVGGALRGVSDPAVQYLRGRGVPMTAGQALGNGGWLGRSVKNVEDALTSVPGVGAIINDRRMEGIEGFNRAAFETAGAPAGVQVGATGADGIQQLRQGVGQAYDNALSGTSIDANSNDYLNDLTDLVNAADRIPNVNGASDAANAAIEARMGGAVDVNGMISGRNFQEAYRGLARTGRERANGDYGHEVGQVMRQGQDALSGALEAQNPGAFTAFRAANSTNRNANVLADAVNRAKNADAEAFTPAQLNMADAASTRRLSGPMASAAGERPFYDLTQAGQSVLPSKLPDSGTATRGMVAMGVLGGGAAGGGAGAAFGDAQTGAGLGLGATLALAVGGSRPAQQALTRLLIDRPDLAVQLGNRLVNGAQRGGAVGAGLGSSVLTPLLVGP